MKSIEEIKKILIQELEELRHDLSELEKERSELSELETKETSEAALRYEMQEDYHLMKERFQKRIKEIERALSKIDENTYGICDKCGQKIEELRLEIDLATNLCKNCALRG
jgi:DnaK suppressor protein